MGKAPAFQFFASDRGMDLMGLDNEAVGAWTKAVIFLWTQGPASEERVALAAEKGWDRVRFLFSQFPAGIGLQWMEEAREKQRIFREKAAIHGGKGGRPPKAKKATLRVAKGSGKGSQRVGSKKNEVEIPFSESVYMGIEVVKEGLPNLVTEGVNLEHYRKSIHNWSDTKGVKRTEKGWLATFRQWTDKDRERKELKMETPVWNPRA